MRGRRSEVRGQRSDASSLVLLRLDCVPRRELRTGINPRRRLGFRLVVCLLLLGMCATTALAHGDEPHDIGDLPFTWGLDPLVVLSLALSGWLYLRGVRRLWR